MVGIVGVMKFKNNLKNILKIVYKYRKCVL